MTEVDAATLDTMAIPGITNVIAGKPIEPSGAGLINVLNPATGEVIADYKESTAADFDLAIRSALTSLTGWAASTPARRAEALPAMVELVDEHRDKTAHLETANAGKPITSVHHDELPGVTNHLRFFAGVARCLTGQAVGEHATGHTSVLRQEPIGVVGKIVPCDFPLSTAVWKIAPALAAGCICVLKLGPNTLLSGSAVLDYLHPKKRHDVVGVKTIGDLPRTTLSVLPECQTPMLMGTEYPVARGLPPTGLLMKSLSHVPANMEGI